MEKTTLIETSVTNYKKGIDLQREMFKNAKVIGDLSLMYNAIENIKIEVKSKAEARGLSRSIVSIEKRLAWIKGLRSRYMVKTKSGYRYRPPKNWKQVSLNHLNESYELLMKILTELKLL